MAATPMFIGTVKSPTVQIATANTARDGTGTLVTVYLPGGTTGGRVDRITITATGTTTTGMIRLFMFDGTNNRLLAELPVVAVTASATQAAFTSEILFEQGLTVQATYALKAATNNAETFNVTMTNGGDYS